EFGIIEQEQANWLTNELRTAPTDKALILAMHHSIYAADDHHSGSARIGKVVDDAIASAGRTPDIVFSATVHNYMRFTRKKAEREIPYLNVGAGGYHNLHHVMRVEGKPITPPTPLDMHDGEQVTLEQYEDSQHGFMRVTVTKGALTG